MHYHLKIYFNKWLIEGESQKDETTHRMSSYLGREIFQEYVNNRMCWNKVSEQHITINLHVFIKELIEYKIQWSVTCIYSEKALEPIEFWAVKENLINKR